MFVESAALRPVCPPPGVRRQSGRAARRGMFKEIDRIVRSGADMVHLRVAEVLAASAAVPDLLDGVDCTPSRERYARVLLMDGQAHCVVALVWSPGQMSPVHGHLTWCALAVHRGALTETHFRHADGGLQTTGAHLLRPRDFSHEPGRSGIHRVANLGTEVAISLHVYATNYDWLGRAVNDVLAA
jgi:3-mercaptopropionate dioxygenase